MKLTSDQIARIQDAYQTSEKFQTVGDLAAVVPGFSGFHVWEPGETVFEESDDGTEDDELYATHRGVTAFSNSKSYNFITVDEDGDEEEIEILIAGDFSAETVDGVVVEETTIEQDIDATEWQIVDIR